jgi:hypothetical protein
MASATRDNILKIWYSGYSDGEGRRYKLEDLARKLSELPVPEGPPATRTLIQLATTIMNEDGEPNKQLTSLNKLDAAFRTAHRERYPPGGGTRRGRRTRRRGGGEVIGKKAEVEKARIAKDKAAFAAGLETVQDGMVAKAMGAQGREYVAKGDRMGALPRKEEGGSRRRRLTRRRR